MVFVAAGSQRFTGVFLPGLLETVLRQMSVEEKSNEIPAVPKLLDLIELSGAVVTLDAMHCQKKTAAKIREQGADYILQVKNNQPKLYRELEKIFRFFRAFRG